MPDPPTRRRISHVLRRDATNTVLSDKRAASPAISQNHSRNVACTTIILEIGHFLAKYSSGRLPYSPARYQPQHLGLKYRTPGQMNTVPSGKKLPYYPTNQRVLRADLRPP
jgi:hypothetical protein